VIKTKDDKNSSNNNNSIRPVAIEKNNLNKCFDKMAVKKLNSIKKKMEI
jgi:hypothetical protein